MPNFGDFLMSAQTKGSNVKVNDLLRAQSKEGVSGTENETSKRLKDVAEMFISAEKQVEDELRTFGNKEVVAELSKLNKGFTAYADNLSLMKFYLSKFSNENAEMSKEDAEKLQELVSQNAHLVSTINNLRTQDKDFNNKFEEVERRNEFHFRSQGVMEIEQAKIQKKYNLSNSELWKDIGEEIDQLKETVKNDMKSGLIEGVGGPIGTLTRKVFAPGFKAIKDSALGKTLGPKLEKWNQNVKDFFLKGNDEEIAIDNALTDQVNADELLNSSQGDIVDAIDTLTDTTKSDSGATDKAIEDSMANVAEEIVLPSPTKMKRKYVLEERAKTGLQRPKEPGVFRKILEASEESNVYLADIVGALKGQLSELDANYQALAELNLIGEDIVKMDNLESMNLLENSDIQKNALTKIRDNTDIQNKKTELINRFNKDVFEYDKEALIESDDDRDENEKTQQEVLKELEKLNRKDMGGGAGGFLSNMFGDMFGSMLGKGAMGAAGKGLLKKLGWVGLILSAGEISMKGISKAMDIKNGGYELNPETNRYEYKEEDSYMGLFDVLSDLPQAAKDMWKGRIKGGNWSGDYVKTANDMRNRELEDQEFNKAMESGQANEKDVTKLTAEDAMHYYDENTPSGKYNLDNLLQELYGDYEVRPRAVEIGGKRYQFNVGAEPKNDQLTEDQLKQMIRELRGETKKEDDKKTSSVSAPTNVDEVKTTASVDNSDLDRDMMQVDKESNELKALAMAGPSGVGGGSNTNVNIAPGSSTVNRKKQNLDEISILPQDNFGLILVNSGLNIG